MELQTELVDYEGLKQLGVTYSKMHLGRLEKAGKFPKRLKLGLGHGKIFWVKAEVDQWIGGLIAKRDAEVAAAPLGWL